MQETPIVGQLPNSKKYDRGVRLVEDPEGTVVFTYVENSDSPFRSPVVVNNAFDNWSQAINFLTLWNILRHVQWW
jgi:hypothetical protein